MKSAKYAGLLKEHFERIVKCFQLMVIYLFFYLNTGKPYINDISRKSRENEGRKWKEVLEFHHLKAKGKKK